VILSGVEDRRPTTDKDARLYRKADGQESRLAYLGHALMEKRNGLVVGAEATLATGTAERDAAAALTQDLPKGATFIRAGARCELRGLSCEAIL
jgi:hypothetical protein